MCARLTLSVAYMLGLLLGSAGEALGQKTVKKPAGAKRFVDVWTNPNLDYDLVIRGDGLCSHVRRDGTIGANGQWQASGNAGTLIVETGKQLFNRFQMLLVHDDVLVLQERLEDGGSTGDGLVLFRKGYDWAGKNANKVAADKKANHLVVGKWTHPNSQRIFEADKQGGWIETRTNGGEPIPAAWSACDDGTFWVEYENGVKMRAWATADGQLALQGFSGTTGEMQGDGMLVMRGK